MLITKANLEALRTGFKTDFQTGVGTAKPTHEPFTTPVNSSARIETYGFLKEWPIFREWLGEKRINSLEEMEYQLLNRNFEVTIGIHKNKIADDSLGLYPRMISGWGEEAGALNDRLVYQALAAGHERRCFDGQPFFDDEHPVAGGVASNISGAGAVQPYFFVDARKSLKPILLQTRQAPTFKMLTDPESDHVFRTGEFLAGGEARAAAGYTFWQLAHRTTAAPSAESYQAAKAAAAGLTNDEGEPLGVRYTHVITGSSNVAGLRNLFKKQNLANGESNIYFGEVEVIEADRLP